MKYVTPAEFALLTGGLRPRKPGAKAAPVAAKGAKQPSTTKAAARPAATGSFKKAPAKSPAKASPKAPAKGGKAAKGRRG
jgi:hypothetical protein